MSAVDFGQNEYELARVFQIGREAKEEAWAVSIGQATLSGLQILEDRLHRRVELLRDREHGIDVERNALALCAERRAELIAGGAPAVPPSAPGGIPAVQAALGAIAPGNGDSDDRFRW